jgi:hypothetical protein
MTMQGFLIGVVVSLGVYVMFPGLVFADSIDCLYKAARDGDLEGVRRALSQGADIDGVIFYEDNGKIVQSDEDGGTPLAFAVYYNDKIDVVKYLVEKGADLNPRNSANQPMPLFYAALRGKLDFVKFLVRAGSDVNNKYPMNLTPLGVAEALGHKSVAKYLLTHGAHRSEDDLPKAMSPEEIRRNKWKIQFETGGRRPRFAKRKSDVFEGCH